MQKRGWIILVLFLAGAGGWGALGADDGGWSRNFSMEGGSLYTEEEHPRIVLEKELLLFDGERTVVWFSFRNTGSRTETVLCGFPVRYDLETYSVAGENARGISRGKYQPEGEIPILSFFETETNPEWAQAPDGLEKHTIHPRMIPAGPENNKRQVIRPEQVPGDLRFSVRQDGRPVEQEDVVVETWAGGADSGGKGTGAALHFRHRLTFPAGEETRLRVEYYPELDQGVLGGIGRDVLRWNYRIGTGGTWKGPLGELMVLVPPGWSGEMDGLSRKTVTAGRGGAPAYQVFHARDYQPSRDARWVLHGSSKRPMAEYEFMEEIFPERARRWKRRRPQLAAPQGPAASFVTDVEASSALDQAVPVFMEEGVIPSVPFAGSSAVDGNSVSAWCEGADGPGVGEYLELRLTQPAAGLAVENGFVHFALNDWFFRHGRGPEKLAGILGEGSPYARDFFRLNGRLKRLRIETVDGEALYSLPLADRRDPQVFPGVFLEPGRYRFVIGGVYPGEAWQDTCLRELRFLPVPPDGGGAVRSLAEDPFYREVLRAEQLRLIETPAGLGTAGNP